MNLTELKIGETGVIQGFTDEKMSIKLMEMGCVPGECVCVKRLAPFGDPIAVEICGYMLSMGRKEASTITIV
jgi:ferrous iron transport protein A